MIATLFFGGGGAGGGGGGIGCKWSDWMYTERDIIIHKE